MLTLIVGLLLLYDNVVLGQYYDGYSPDIGNMVLKTAERLISNDELQCLPRLLCEQIAGGQPGQVRGLQVDTQSLFTLLQYLGVDDSISPMIGMGKALLAGLSSKGDPYSCYTKYPRCPRDQTRLLHYLNNHRGGFFRGFSRPYYGKSESRIVNQNVFDRPILSLNDFPQNNYQNEIFSFSNRKPKTFAFEVLGTDRLPSRFQFPDNDYDKFQTNRFSQFFPLE